METSGTGIGRLDCYEDMFKEITRKLYGEDPDQRTSNVQNEFEASVTFKAEEPFKTDDDEAATEASDDATSWILDDEPLKGTDGSRIAAYRATTSTWRCYECGDCVAGGTREVAEHFVELHSLRLDDSDSRVRMPRKQSSRGQGESKIDDIILYLEKLQERADKIMGISSSRRSQEPPPTPAVLLPVNPNFLIQEIPVTPPQQLQQPQPEQQANPVAIGPIRRSTRTSRRARGNNATGKKYFCPHCPYGTDRRDLYTRHMNIHCETKPFYCYVCGKLFSRADHVKKHFLRMHKGYEYDVTRIRTPKPEDQPEVPPESADNLQQQQQHQQPSNNVDVSAILQAANIAGTANADAPLPELSAAVIANIQTRRLNNTGGKAQSKSTGGTKKQERRFKCCYCSWTGADNWCLKRHLNTHIKPFACQLCDYKAARSERLSTHVLKVHNRRQCPRCPFLGNSIKELQIHQINMHRTGNPRSSSAATATVTSAPPTLQQQIATNVHQQQSHSNDEHQMHLLNGGTGGRAPPGPPVFPASSSSIAPATTSISPTTILGERTSTAGTDSYAKEAYSYEASFQQLSIKREPSRRSRKQSTPRRAIIDPTRPVRVIENPKLIEDDECDCEKCPECIMNSNLKYRARLSFVLHRMSDNGEIFGWPDQMAALAMTKPNCVTGDGPIACTKDNSQ